MDPGQSPSWRAQKPLPGPTSPASHGPSILGSTICGRFQPMNKSQLAPLVQIKHIGATTADWLTGEVHWGIFLPQIVGASWSWLQRKETTQKHLPMGRAGVGTLLITVISAIS